MDILVIKILHIFDCAGVAQVIARAMDATYSTKSTLTNRAELDSFYYNPDSENIGSTSFLIKSVIRSLRYDVVFVHSYDRLVPVLNSLGVPTILYYHGDDIRRKWNERRKYWIKARQIIVSTADLLEGAPPNVNLVEAPVDTSLFTNRKMGLPENAGKALHIITRQINEPPMPYQAEINAQKNGYSLTVFDRAKTPIPHKEMPSFLSQFECYVDRTYVHVLSLTACEFLAMGGKVIKWDGEIISGLPKEREPIVASKKVYDIVMKL